ncbi:uncharacterized protein FA14DRAFT_182051 [Meira miltonrushii]|uniref:GH16 domain-containing protein n=1 Tax=Meira miltonrushii TaxID=1280837 RepID=A0A316V3J7_9BASI|nr:uncharacterized protein FA14DRAFT_182051 [Meira miltonrushii]PWN32137.1 hypothetical protein FA14DRAFT_182051 [Meira miltonrushii]
MRFTLFTATILALSLTLQSTSATITNEEFPIVKALDATTDLLSSFNGDQGASASHVHALEARSSPHVSIFRRHSRLAKRCSSKLHASKKDVEHTTKEEHHHKSSDKKKHSDSKHSDSKHKSTSNNDATSTNVKAAKKKSDSKSKSKSSSSSSGHVTNTDGSGDYSRVESNRGNNFWSQNNWDFWSYADPTHGQVAYQSEQNAKNQGLIGTKDGAAFLRMSDKDISGTNRPSVRFQSKKAYDSGLIIFDVEKMPVGCGTWPALWTTDGGSWPHGGEIDVMEGVGYTSGGKNENQMTVHLGENSPLQLNRRALEPRASFIGRIMEGATNCNQWGSHTGCAFFDSNKNGPSWGTDFNNAGGGIWAMQFGNNGGVKIWFWGRKSGKIPEELSKPSQSPKKLDPSSWGKPMANFQSDVINQKVKKQNIIINITAGGDWAGNVPLDGKCKGQNIWQAIKKGSNYDDAEFIINGVDVYCKNGKC